MLRQEPNLGEDKGGLLGPEKDKCKVCSLLDKAHKLAPKQFYSPRAGNVGNVLLTTRNPQNHFYQC